MSITQNLPQHFDMLPGLGCQMGKGLPVHGMIPLTFKESQIGVKPLKALAQILALLGRQSWWWLLIAVNPLPYSALGISIHIHHSSEYFMPKSKKCAKKVFHFPFICAIMSKIQK